MGKVNFEISKLKVSRPNFNLQLDIATPEDVKPTTELIHKAYKYWIDNGVIVSPATQNEETTRSHLLSGQGFVLKNEKQEIKATFSLDQMNIFFKNDILVAKTDSNNNELTYKKLTTFNSHVAGAYLEFKKLAVTPELMRNGIGRELHEIAENYALKSRRYSGMAIETVKEATWLYKWYLTLGYEVYGKLIYEGSKLETFIMVKEL